MTTPGHRVTLLATERYALQVTIGEGTHEKLRYAQALLSHALPSGDLAQVLDRALDALVEKIEKQKFAASARSRAGSHRGTGRSGSSPRHVPLHVRQVVWERDGGRWTFVSEAGKRCEARAQLELDHVVPVARGGEATVEGLRLLCRSHNQLEAERTFGAGFMEEKREEARRASTAGREAARRERASGRGAEPSRKAEAKREIQDSRTAEPDDVAESDSDRDVVPWLRSLGVRADQAKRAAAAVEHLVDASLEERVKAAFAFHAQARFPGARRPASCAAATT